MGKWYKVVIETQGFDAVAVYAEDENEAMEITNMEVSNGDYYPTDDEPNIYYRTEETSEDELSWLIKVNREENSTEDDDDDQGFAVRSED